MDSVRSEVMSRIRRRDTVPEILLRKALWAEGLRYRVDYRTPHGRPDVVFLRSKVAIFVDGCFWHGCPDHYVRPRSRVEFWAEKLLTNVQRDRRQTLALESSGWRVLRFWEHEVYLALPAAVAAIRDSLANPKCGNTRRVDWRVVAVEPREDDRERRIMESLRSGEVRDVVHRLRSTQKW